MIEDLSGTHTKQNAEKRELLAKKYAQYILKEISSGNFQMYDFIRELKKYVDDKTEKKKEEKMKNIQECANIIEKYITHKNELEKKLSDEGVTQTFPLTYKLELEYYKIGDSKKEDFEIYQRTNGCKINKELLTEEGIAKLKEEYENAKTINKAYDKDIERIEQQIETEEKKLKRTLLTRKRMQIKGVIDGEREELNTVKSLKRDENLIKQTIGVVEELNPSQKENLVDYLQTTEDLLLKTNELDLFKKGIINIQSGKDKDIVTEAFKTMIREKEMDEKAVTEIFSMIKKIENKIDKEVYVYKILEDNDNNLGGYRNTIESFIRYVYEPEKPISTQSFLEMFKNGEAVLNISKNEEKGQKIEENSGE